MTVNKPKLAIIITVLAAAGLGGWYIYHKKQGDTSTVKKHISSFAECVAAGNPVMESYPEQCAADGQTFVNDKQSNTQPNTDETANWLLYEPPGKEYSVRLADGWKLERYQQSSSFYTFDNTNLGLVSNTKAVVQEVDGGKDGRTGLFFNYATQNIDQIVTPGQKQASLKTKDGLEIEKYYWVVSGQTDEGLGTQNGDTQYTYVIRHSANRVIVVSYSYQPAGKDYHELVETVIKTVHFN